MTPVWPGDHPRSRGVYGNMRQGMESHGGSSPLARGLLTPAGEMIMQGRIIPARAGFTGTRSTCRRAGTDHPRSRGVYALTARNAFQAWGSSPLARGLLLETPDGRDAEGIIPARAGFTAEATPETVSMRDHPRSRGVYKTPAICPRE